MRAIAGIRGSRVVLPLLFAVGVALTTPSEAQTKLRWKFKPGQKVGYEMVMDIGQEMTIKDMPVKTKMTQRIDMDWEVKDVAKDGNATVTQTISRVRVDVVPAVPGQPAIKYDSAAKQEEQDPNGAMLGKIFGLMIGHPTTLTITPLGEVTDIQFAPEMLEMMKNANPGGAAIMSEDSMKEMVRRSMFSFPAEVKPGQTWEAKVETPNPMLGKQVVDTKYTYVGPEKLGDREVEKIDMKVNVQIDPAPEAQAKIEMKDQTGGGTILFDNNQGLPAETKSTTALTMKISIGDQSIDQTIKTDVSMKQKTSEKE